VLFLRDIGHGRRLLQEARRKERGRTRRGQRVWKRTGRPRGRPKTLVPIVRLACKQRLLPSKGKAKIANTPVRSDEIKRLEVELAMQGKSILALQRKGENLQGELVVQIKKEIADAMEKESILALQRKVGNLQGELVVHNKRRSRTPWKRSSGKAEMQFQVPKAKRAKAWFRFDGDPVSPSTACTRPAMKSAPSGLERVKQGASAQAACPLIC